MSDVQRRPTGGQLSPQWCAPPFIRQVKNRIFISLLLALEIRYASDPPPFLYSLWPSKWGGIGSRSFSSSPDLLQPKELAAISELFSKERRTGSLCRESSPFFWLLARWRIAHSSLSKVTVYRFGFHSTRRFSLVPFSKNYTINTGFFSAFPRNSPLRKGPQPPSVLRRADAPSSTSFPARAVKFSPCDLPSRSTG